MIALVRYTLADVVRSQRILPPLALFLSVLMVLYAVGPNPVLSSYGATSLLLFPLAAWCTAAVLGSEDPVQRHITAVHAGGTGRAGAGKVDAAIVVAAILTVAAVVLPWLTGALEVPGGPGEGRFSAFIPYVGLGVLAHLTVALPAVAIAAAWSPPAVRRTGTTLAGTAVCLILAAPLDTLSRSASWLPRLLVHAVPPFEVARVMADDTPPATVLSHLLPSLVGGLVFTAAVVGAYVALVRRRS